VIERGAILQPLPAAILPGDWNPESVEIWEEMSPFLGMLGHSGIGY